MKQQQCPVCKQIVDLEDEDKIKACYGEGHITLKEWEYKQEHDKEKEKDV